MQDSDWARLRLPIPSAGSANMLGVSSGRSESSEVPSSWFRDKRRQAQPPREKTEAERVQELKMKRRGGLL